MTNEELIRLTATYTNPRQINEKSMAGKVAAGLISTTGKVYFGIDVETSCNLGTCAEVTAIGAMLTAGEKDIATLVAVHHKHGVITPCGRCREYLIEISESNWNTNVIIGNNEVVPLTDLLPRHRYSSRTEQ